MEGHSELDEYVANLKGLSDDEFMDVWAKTNPNIYYYVACNAEMTRRKFRGEAMVLEAQRKAADAEAEASRAALATAEATSKNARYMLWSVVAAAASAIITALGVAFNVFSHP